MAAALANALAKRGSARQGKAKQAAGKQQLKKARKVKKYIICVICLFFHSSPIAKRKNCNSKRNNLSCFPYLLTHSPAPPACRREKREIYVVSPPIRKQKKVLQKKRIRRFEKGVVGGYGMVWYHYVCMCAGCVCVVQEVKFEKAVVGGDRWYVKGSSGREGRDVG